MFGKSVAEYLGFQKLFLALIALVGLARLGLSLAGLPNSSVMWFSMTGVALAGVVYYGAAVHTRGFGSYKQLLPLAFFQMSLMHLVAVLGIVVSIAGFANIYTAPEFSGPSVPTSQWTHALAHLTIGIMATTVLGWAIAAVVLLVTKRVAPRPAAA